MIVASFKEYRAHEPERADLVPEHIVYTTRSRNTSYLWRCPLCHRQRWYRRGETHRAGLLTFNPYCIGWRFTLDKPIDRELAQTDLWHRRMARYHQRRAIQDIIDHPSPTISDEELARLRRYLATYTVEDEA